jgi:hypothetical protein
MMAAATKPRVIGKGLTEKRGASCAALDAHLRYLVTVETMSAWTPPERPERPARPPDPDPYRLRPASYFYSAREKPELKYPAPGPEALSEEDVKAWVQGDPFVRGGLAPKTQRAMAFIATFAPTLKYVRASRPNHRAIEPSHG